MLSQLRKTYVIAVAAAVLSASAIPASSQQQPAAAAPRVTMELPVSGTYEIDPMHAQVRATWLHMGLSRPGATFESVQGTIDIDASNPEKSSVKVRIPIRSIDTGVPAFDEHILSSEFFDVGKFPDATYVSRSVQFTGMGNAFTVTGDLTIRGVTKSVTLDAVLNGAGMHPMVKVPAVGFSATATLRRSDFGVDAVVPLVSDEVKLFITAEAVRKP